MKGCTEKVTIFQLFFTNNKTYKKKSTFWDHPFSFFKKKKTKYLQKFEFLKRVNILVVLHHLQKKLNHFNKKIANNNVLLLWTSKMSISIAWLIVQWGGFSDLRLHRTFVPLPVPAAELPRLELRKNPL